LEASSKALLPFIGTIVKTMRHARGWSQEELAEAASLFPNQISLLERAERSPNLKTLERVTGAFGIPCYALFWQAEMLRSRVEGDDPRTKGD
jgi:transcriptional regulator with XRE-family HTH domain